MAFGYSVDLIQLPVMKDILNKGGGNGTVNNQRCEFGGDHCVCSRRKFFLQLRNLLLQKLHALEVLPAGKKTICRHLGCGGRLLMYQGDGERMGRDGYLSIVYFHDGGASFQRFLPFLDTESRGGGRE
jgi:hypothetical protein